MSKAKADMSFQDFEKSKQSKAAAKKGKVEHLHTERLDNGYMTTARHERPAPSQGREIYQPPTESKHFHKTPEEMGSHHSVMMGGQPLVPSSPGKKAEDDADEAGEKGD